MKINEYIVMLSDFLRPTFSSASAQALLITGVLSLYLLYNPSKSIKPDTKRTNELKLSVNKSNWYQLVQEWLPYIKLTSEQQNTQHQGHSKNTAILRRDRIVDIVCRDIVLTQIIEILRYRNKKTSRIGQTLDENSQLFEIDEDTPSRFIDATKQRIMIEPLSESRAQSQTLIFHDRHSLQSWYNTGGRYWPIQRDINMNDPSLFYNTHETHQRQIIDYLTSRLVKDFIAQLGSVQALVDNMIEQSFSSLQELLQEGILSATDHVVYCTPEGTIQYTTLLHCAVQANNIAAAQCLLNFGANPHALNSNGENCLQLATSNQMNSVLSPRQSLVSTGFFSQNAEEDNLCTKIYKCFCPGR